MSNYINSCINIICDCPRYTSFIYIKYNNFNSPNKMYIDWEKLIKK